jgi:DNA polymerase-3 subunit delta'
MSEKIPLIGNQALHQQLEGRPLSHAYILSGPVGSGRHTAARWISKAMVCSAPEGQRPCGHCSNCRKVSEGIHPDVVWVSDGSGIKVEEARDLRSDAYVRPNEADRKVYLFENAGALSEKVQNVLLKLVEEGPEYAAFLFLTEHAGQLLITIRSRCEELKLTPVSPAQVEEVLKERLPQRSQEELHQAALSSGGMVGQALARLEAPEDEETAALDQLAEQFCAALARKDELALAAFLATEEKRSRQELTVFCEGCRSRFYAALMAGAGQQNGKATAATRALTGLKKDQLFRLCEHMEEAKRRLDGNAGSGHLLGWLVVSCISAAEG